jgi:hypothetical protein
MWHEFGPDDVICPAWSMDELPVGAVGSMDGVKGSQAYRKSCKLRRDFRGTPGLLLPKRWFQSAVVDAARHVAGQDIWIPRLAVAALQFGAENHLSLLLRRTSAVVGKHTRSIVVGGDIQQVASVLHGIGGDRATLKDTVNTSLADEFVSEHGGHTKRYMLDGSARADANPSPENDRLTPNDADDECVRWEPSNGTDDTDDTDYSVYLVMPTLECHQQRFAEPARRKLDQPWVVADPIGREEASRCVRTVARLLGRLQPRHCLDPSKMAEKIHQTMREHANSSKSVPGSSGEITLSAQAMSIIQLIVEAKVGQPLATAAALRTDNNVTVAVAGSSVPNAFLTLQCDLTTAPADGRTAEVLAQLAAKLNPDEVGWTLLKRDAPVIVPSHLRQARHLLSR